MNLKGFLKPTKGKTVVFVVLAILSLFMPSVWGDLYAGFPLGYISPLARCMFAPFTPDVTCPQPEFNCINFIIDLIIWYLLAAVIVFVFQRFRKPTGQK